MRNLASIPTMFDRFSTILCFVHFEGHVLTSTIDFRPSYYLTLSPWEAAAVCRGMFRHKKEGVPETSTYY